MLAKSEKEFVELFKNIEDPREDEKVLYPISEILFLAISGILSCAESWRELVQYGNMNIDFLRKYFPYANGIPSKSVLSRIFGIIDKKAMESILLEFAAYFYQKHDEEIIALDGKRIKGSSVHLLHALSTRLGIVLAQVDIDNKINESVEIPKMLEKLDISDAVITADALNCQKAIAEKIRDKGAHYFLALKGNQGTLLEDVKSYFLDKGKLSYFEDINKEHGRLERRSCWTTDKIDWLKKEHPNWRDINSISCIERERNIKGETSREQVFYISSTDAVVNKHLQYSREHWAIENKLHWVLDVVFKEDQSTFRAGNAAQNMAIIRKLAINIIKRYKETTGDKRGVKMMRKISSWSSNSTEELLKFIGI